jgi:arylsulfatase A-like enzyme
MPIGSGIGLLPQYTHDLFTMAATNFVSNNKPDQFNKQRPFFLYLAYTIPHANNEVGRATGNGMQVPSDEPYSDEQWTQVEKNKAAMITRMDADIGRLLDKLKQLKIDENTVVFFTSDNGPLQGRRGGSEVFQQRLVPRTKRDLYEGGTRADDRALAGRIKQGQVSDFTAAFWDFLPTARTLR